MAIRKRLRELAESKKRYCLVFWPEEKCYSEVLEAKLLEPKEATVGVVAKVKEGGKIHSGSIVMVGTRAEVERRLNELERVDSSEAEDQAKDSEEPGASDSIAVGGQVSKQTSKKQAQKRRREQAIDDGKPPKKKKKMSEGQKKPKEKASAAAKGQKRKTKAEGKIIQIVAHDGITTEQSQPQSGSSGATAQSESSAETQQPSTSTGAEGPGSSAVAAAQSESTAATQTSSSAEVPPQPGTSSVAAGIPPLSASSGVAAGEPSRPGPSAPPKQPPALLDVSITTISSVSSVSPLPSPIQQHRSLTTSPPKLKPPHEAIESLTLEIKVQDLIDRVTVLEEGQAHMLEMQRSILQKQEDILSRLVTLENKQFQDRSHHMYSFNELDYSFLSDDDQPPVFIPPPPVHPAPVLPPASPSPRCPPRARRAPVHPPQRLPPAHRLPRGLQPASAHPPPGSLPPAYPPVTAHPPPAHPPATAHPPPAHPPVTAHPPPESLPPGSLASPHPPTPTSVQQSSRPPFRQLQPSARQKRKAPKPALPSSSIDCSSLTPVDVVIGRHRNLLCESKLATLAQKLAKEAYFGEAIMVQCTVAGDRDLPGLPVEELQQLKQKLLSIFPQYWKSPFEFEAQWKSAIDSIGQACKRLRANSKQYLQP